ncbi:MAG: serine/threonine protein kinase [Sandaracinus sp.]|nr:serine/threonine protein kinase [Sandaracinus sp.]
MTPSPSTDDASARFEILTELGSGGMASVHLARARAAGGFQKWVAIKRIHPHLAKEDDFVAMFLDEARIAAQLHHPNVAQVFELGRLRDDWFLAMEYLHGESLDRVLKRLHERDRRMPLALAAYVVAQVASGLHHAHEARGQDGQPMQLVHRDVTPHNVLVTFDGHVKLTDFGVAKAAGRLTKTVTGTMKGKMAYASPEQLAGEELDRRSDVFALGVVLWEACTATRLFRGASDAETVQRILSGRRQPIGAHRDDVPAALEEVAARALAQDPEDRYPTAAAMADALQAFLRSVPAVGAADLATLLDEELGDEKAAKESLLAAGGTLEGVEGTRTDVDLPVERSPAEASPTDPVAVAEATRPASTLGAEPTRSMEEQTPPRRALAWIVVAAVLALAVLAATQLVPSAAPPRLRVASSPEGGQVFVDDRALGRA